MPTRETNSTSRSLPVVDQSTVGEKLNEIIDVFTTKPNNALPLVAQHHMQRENQDNPTSGNFGGVAWENTCPPSPFKVEVRRCGDRGSPCNTTASDAEGTTSLPAP